MANWVDQQGGLPPLIKRTAAHIAEKNPDWDQSRCIATAVAAIRRIATNGDTNLPGVQQVGPKARAAAVAALAQWERMKAAARRVDASRVGDAVLDLATGAHRYRHGWILVNPAVPSRGRGGPRPNATTQVSAGPAARADRTTLGGGTGTAVPRTSRDRRPAWQQRLGAGPMAAPDRTVIGTGTGRPPRAAKKAAAGPERAPAVPTSERSAPAPVERRPAPPAATPLQSEHPTPAPRTRSPRKAAAPQPERPTPARDGRPPADLTDQELRDQTQAARDNARADPRNSAPHIARFAELQAEQERRTPRVDYHTLPPKRQPARKRASAPQPPPRQTSSTPSEYLPRQSREPIGTLTPMESEALRQIGTTGERGTHSGGVRMGTRPITTLLRRGLVEHYQPYGPDDIRTNYRLTAAGRQLLEGAT